jgi:ABC-type nitrate/sulfonate/bicarbonate transport system permease component
MATPSTLVRREPVGRYAPRVERHPLTRRQRLARAFSPRDRLLQLGLLAVLLGVWEYVGRRSDRFTFAPPTSVISAAGDLIGSGELQRAVVSSLNALALGFAAAAIVGVGLGFAMGVWHTFGRTLDPFVAALYVVPIAAIIPAIVAWIGLGLESRVLVVFLFAVFEPLLAAYAGVKQVDPALYDAARTFGARRGELVRRVTLPATLPFVFVGLRMGAARAVKGMVLAEMLFSVTGLGRLIVESAQDFRIDKVLVAVVAVSLIGVVATATIKVAERYALRWRR